MYIYAPVLTFINSAIFLTLLAVYYILAVEKDVVIILVIFRSEFLDEMHSIRKISKEINTAIEDQQTLVHCPDGAGRTGVVILAEVILGLIEQNEVLNSCIYHFIGPPAEPEGSYKFSSVHPSVRP